MLYPDDETFDFVGSEKYRQIAETGTGAVETCWLTKNGNTIHVLLSSTPFDTDNLSLGVTFTALDISHRKLAENALAESETLQRTLLANLPAGVMIVDPDDKNNRERKQDHSSHVCGPAGGDCRTAVSFIYSARQTKGPALSAIWAMKWTIRNER